MGKNKKKPHPTTIEKHKEAKLCLNMIVRNEAHVKHGQSIIERCLNNIGHLIDAIAIVDTGSDDGTPELIVKWAREKGIPQKITIDPWQDDFGYHRSGALRLAEDFVKELSEKTWYCLFMDADNMAFANDGVSLIHLDKSKLVDDGYKINMRQEGCVYSYLWLIKLETDKPWQWYCPRHEYCSPQKNKNGVQSWQCKIGYLDNGFIESKREGSRARDPRRYLRDAHVFEKALLDDPFNDRYLYYAAQSYNDIAKQFKVESDQYQEQLKNADISEKEKEELAIKAQQAHSQCQYYWQRAEKAFVFRASTPPFTLWQDEYTYCAWVEAGKIRLYRKGDYDTTALRYFYQAYQKRAHRLEAPYYLLCYYVRNQAYRVGWSLAKDLINLPYPSNDDIFVDDAIHQYNFLFEASLCAFYSGANQDCVKLCKRVIRNRKTPTNIREAAENNLILFGRS